MSVRRSAWQIVIRSASVSALAISLTTMTWAADRDVGSPAASALFEELSPSATGVKFVHRLALEHPLAYLYESGFPCGGVCVGDVDGDAKPDIFVVSGPDDNALFLNKGNFVFEKSPASNALGDWNRWGVSATLADLDNDDDLDVLLCNYNGPNRLFVNDGRGQFEECGGQAGIAYVGPSQCLYVADFDGDGDLDLFLLTNRLYSRAGRPRGAASERGPDGQARIKDEFAPFFRVVRPSVEVPPDQTVPIRGLPPPFMLEYGHPDRFYRNDGAGSNGIPCFTDVTPGSGLENVPGHGLSALIWDINDDGRPDIYVANDYTDKDNLWLNLGPDADGGFRFRDAIDEFFPYTPLSSMGSDLADVDGDGRLDFMVADMAGTTHFKDQTTMNEITGWRRWVLEHGWPRQTMRNTLFLNSGTGRFQEIAWLAGVARSDWTWAVKFGDFDLDGRSDLFMATGAARLFNYSDFVITPSMWIGRPLWEAFKDKPEGREKNLAFHNEGGLRFSEVSRVWNLDKESMSYGAATGDFDSDGDLDLIVCNLGENVSLYRNRAAQTGAHWLKMRLEGKKNRFGIGAIVTAHLPKGNRLTRLMNPGTGFLSGNEPVLHFGLGEETKVERLEIRWPAGAVQILGPQSADQLIVANEMGAADRKSGTETPATAPQFSEVAQKIGLRFRHKENAHDDYQRESLLPAKLSQLGPGIAVGDINADGLDDIFVGGAAGQSAALFIHQPDHTFRLLEGASWAAHAGSEDMGALFFDADRDGDLDLYVASGSNEWESNDVHYADHLYLNQTRSGGQTVFVEAPLGVLPDLRQAGSCVVAADFDRDGDLDLFVGARSVPGKYPLTPSSVLLRNDSKPGEVSFTDITDSTAPGLRRVGLVTAGLWTDADDDGWPDLFITCEWGVVSLFLNRESHLVNVTEQAGLAARFGWWNSIVGGDFDADGDIDYAVLNAGLNTKYGKATLENQIALYRGDMDGNGSPELVEARSSPQGELPVRGRASSSAAMPSLKERFPSYEAFAVATLPEIYGEERLKHSLKVTANELQSGLLINESTSGHPRFAWRPLPSAAQFSPCFGAVAADFFGAQRPALALAQNLYSREPETGLWRGGLGCILRPLRNNQFQSEEHSRSGFLIPGDGKGLALADLDSDGWPDLIASQNNDVLLAFRNRPREGILPLVIRLIGPPGNPQGAGARVSLLADTKAYATTEIYAGSGYLSQSTSAASFFLPTGKQEMSISVRWPNGQTTSTKVASEQRLVKVPFPDSQ